MSKETATNRLSIDWAEEAKSQLRAIDRQTALDILHCTDRYLLTRNGDVSALKSPLTGYRLRCGDYRLFFKPFGDHGILVSSVQNRREAYR